LQNIYFLKDIPLSISPAIIHYPSFQEACLYTIEKDIAGFSCNTSGLFWTIPGYGNFAAPADVLPPRCWQHCLEQSDRSLTLPPCPLYDNPEQSSGLPATLLQSLSGNISSQEHGFNFSATFPHADQMALHLYSAHTPLACMPGPSQRPYDAIELVAQPEKRLHWARNEDICQFTALIGSIQKVPPLFQYRKTVYFLRTDLSNVLHTRKIRAHQAATREQIPVAVSDLKSNAILPTCSATPTEDESNRIKQLLQESMFNIETDKYKEAEVLLQEALKLVQGSTNGQNKKAHVLALLGLLRLEQGMYKQALILYEDALGLAYHQADQKLIDSILPAIAVVYFSLGDAATALLFLTQMNQQSALLELQRLPALLKHIKCVPQLAQLRAFLSLEGEIVQERIGASLVTGTTHAQVRPSRLSIQGFGEPIVLLDGQPIKRWRTARALELFFFLLNTNQPVNRERIINALWPHADEQTRQTFHATVHHLRKTLGAPVLVFQGGYYYLDLAIGYGEQIWYDVQAFQTYDTQARLAMARADDVSARIALTQMVALYHGDYGRPFYNNWCSIQRDKLRATYQEALSQLARIAWRQHALTECVAHWRHVLRIDNCLEEAHLGLMQCYVQQGKRSLALRQYQECSAILQQELGVEPEAPIQLFYQSLTNTLMPVPKR
jgi:DNA-binding SARP family transcriptional activator